jgi:hypothetical protein
MTLAPWSASLDSSLYVDEANPNCSNFGPGLCGAALLHDRESGIDGCRRSDGDRESG